MTWILVYIIAIVNFPIGINHRWKKNKNQTKNKKKNFFYDEGQIRICYIVLNMETKIYGEHWPSIFFFSFYFAWLHLNCKTIFIWSSHYEQLNWKSQVFWNHFIFALVTRRTKKKEDIFLRSKCCYILGRQNPYRVCLIQCPIMFWSGKKAKFNICTPDKVLQTTNDKKKVKSSFDSFMQNIIFSFFFLLML